MRHPYLKITKYGHFVLLGNLGTQEAWVQIQVQADTQWNRSPLKMVVLWFWGGLFPVCKAKTTGMLISGHPSASVFQLGECQSSFL